MGRRRGGNGGRVDGEDEARAEFLTYWSPARRPGMTLADVPTEVYDRFLEQARAEPPAITHPVCCWCSRCEAAARAHGGWPMDEQACRRLHSDGAHA